jgi:hypothetical protein
MTTRLCQAPDNRQTFVGPEIEVVRESRLHGPRAIQSMCPTNRLSIRLDSLTQVLSATRIKSGRTLKREIFSGLN